MQGDIHEDALAGVPTSELPKLAALAANMHGNLSLKVLLDFIQKHGIPRETGCVFTEQQRAHLLETAVIRGHYQLVTMLCDTERQFTEPLTPADAASAATTAAAADLPAHALGPAQSAKRSTAQYLTESLLVRLLRITLLRLHDDAAAQLRELGFASGTYWSPDPRICSHAMARVELILVMAALCSSRLVQR